MLTIAITITDSAVAWTMQALDCEPILVCEFTGIRERNPGQRLPQYSGMCSCGYRGPLRPDATEARSDVDAHMRLDPLYRVNPLWVWQPPVMADARHLQADMWQAEVANRIVAARTTA